MKKIFLALALTFATIPMINANSNSNNNHDCFRAADIGASTLGILYDLSYETEHEVFLMLYDECLAQN